MNQGAHCIKHTPNNNFTFNTLSVIHKSISNPQTASRVGGAEGGVGYNNPSNIFKI